MKFYYISGQKKLISFHQWIFAVHDIDTWYLLDNASIIQSKESEKRKSTGTGGPEQTLYFFE